MVEYILEKSWDFVQYVTMSVPFTFLLGLLIPILCVGFIKRMFLGR